MSTNLIIILFLALLTAGVGVMAWRSHRIAKRYWRWPALTVTGAVTVLFGAITLGLTVGAYKAYTPRSAPARTVTIAGTPEQIARGRHLADTFCASCHGVQGQLPLTGGFDLGTDIPIPLGHFVAANLTPAGRIATWSDADLFRAIRHGIGPDGELLYVMWTARGRNLSDADTEAVIAYLRSTPAAGQASPTPPDAYSPLGLLMLGAGQLPEGAPPDPATVTQPPLEATADYGAYIVGYQDCVICHGPDLRGGVPGQLAPIGPNLALVRGWTADEFIATLRTGVDPNGHVLNPDLMPYENIGRMTDTELTALYQYLTSLEEETAVSVER